MSKFYNEKLNEFLHPQLRSLSFGYVRHGIDAQQLPRLPKFRHRHRPPKWLRLRRPLLLPPSSPLWPTPTTDSPSGGLLSGSLTREPWRTSQKRSSVSSGFLASSPRPSILCCLRATSHFTRPLHNGISCNPQLNVLLQPPTSPTFSSTVLGPISRKTSRSPRCFKSPTRFRWLRRRHLRRTTLEPFLRTTRLVTLRCYPRPSLTRCQVLLTGNVDSEGNVNGRFNHGWTPASVTKVQAQV